MNFADDDFDYSEDVSAAANQNERSSQPGSRAQSRQNLAESPNPTAAPALLSASSTRAPWLSWNPSSSASENSSKPAAPTTGESSAVNVRKRISDVDMEVALPSFLSDSAISKPIPRSARAASSAQTAAGGAEKRPLSGTYADQIVPQPVKPINWLEKTRPKSFVEPEPPKKNEQTKSFLDLIMDVEEKKTRSLDLDAEPARPKTAGKAPAPPATVPSDAQDKIISETEPQGWPYKSSVANSSTEPAIQFIDGGSSSATKTKAVVTAQVVTAHVDLAPVHTGLAEIQSQLESLKMIIDSQNDDGSRHTDAAIQSLSDRLMTLQQQQQEHLSSFLGEITSSLHASEQSNTKTLADEMHGWQANLHSTLQQVRDGLKAMVVYREDLVNLEKRVETRKSEAAAREQLEIQELKQQKAAIIAEVEQLRLESDAISGRRDALNGQVDDLQKQVLTLSEEKRRNNIEIEDLKLKITQLKDDMAPMKVYQRELHDQEVRIKTLQQDLDARQQKTEQMLNDFHEEERKLQLVQARLGAEQQKLESRQRQIDKERAVLAAERSELERERELTRNFYETQWAAKLKQFNEQSRKLLLEQDTKPVEMASQKFYSNTLSATTHLHSVAEKILAEEKHITSMLKSHTEEVQLTKKYREELNALNQNHWQFLASSFQQALIAPTHRPSLQPHVGN